MLGKTNLAIENTLIPTDKSYVQRLDTDIANMTVESLNFWNIRFVEELWKENHRAEFRDTSGTFSIACSAKFEIARV